MRFANTPSLLTIIEKRGWDFSMKFYREASCGCGCWIGYARNGKPIAFGLCDVHRLETETIKRTDFAKIITWIEMWIG